MTKRGLSDVVTTVLIVVIALAAIAIVWGVVQGFLEGNSDFDNSDSVTLDLEILNVGVVDVDTLDVQVKREAGSGNLAGIVLIIAAGVDEETFVFSGDEVSDLKRELDTQTFTIDLNSLATSDLTEVSVAPIYLTPQGNNKTGVVVDRQSI